MTRIRGALPWLLAAVAIAMDVAGGLLMLRNASRAPGLFVPQVFMVPGYAAVGAVVASRRRTHPAGWLFLGVGIISAGIALSFSFASAVLVTKIVSFPGAVIAAWLSNWLFPLGFVFFGFVLLLFPTGSLPSRRWRWLPTMLVVAWGMFVIVSMFGPGAIELGTGTKVANPFPIGAVRPLGGLLYPFLVFPAFGGLLLCAAAPFFRRRRASQIEREQLRWLAYACGFGAATTLVAVVAAALKNETVVAVFGSVVLLTLALGVPVAVGMAILRYRLFDIDRIISRTLSYGLVTAVLVGVFALVVLLPTTTIGSGATPGWLVALATLVVFGLFRPVLRRVRSVVDRRFNRSRYDAARTIDAFSARLRDEIDLATLRQELTGVVGETMQPRHVSLWIRGATR